MNVLYVEDEEIKRTTVVRFLDRKGVKTKGVETAEAALVFLEKNPCDVLISDVRLPGMDGTELLRRVRERYPELTVLMVTAYATVDLAVDVMRQGAYDFLTKPFRNEALLLKLRRIETFQDRQEENLALRLALDRAGGALGIVGPSPEMRQVAELIRTIAPGPSTVLILGESGTGKELVARAIHQSSGRISSRFIAFNCAALPTSLVESELFGHEKGAFTGAVSRRQGRFERANGGTLFLDDVDAMPLEVQAKLLRVLEEHEIERVGSSTSIEVDVRVIASARPQIRQQVEEGTFRGDLYYRLAVIPVILPPLRDRPDDIEPLLAHFVDRQRKKGTVAFHSFSAEAIELLKQYRWPGNVRELRNLVERLSWILHKEVADVCDLPEEYLVPAGSKAGVCGPIDVTKMPFRKFIEQAERAYFSWAMDRSQGNLSEAARLLNIPRTTLHDRLQHQNTQTSLSESDDG